MKTKLNTISVGALLLVAGSANAQTLVDFNDVLTPSGFAQLSGPGPTGTATYKGFTLGGDIEVMDQTYWQSNYGGNTSGFTGKVAYTGNDFAGPLTFARSDTNFSLDSLNIGKIWPTIGGIANTSVTIKGLLGGIEVASQTINLSASNVQTVSFSGAFGNIDKISMEHGSQYAYFESFTYSPVPEPGTMAALGGGVLALLKRRKKG